MILNVTDQIADRPRLAVHVAKWSLLRDSVPIRIFQRAEHAKSRRADPESYTTEPLCYTARRADTEAPQLPRRRRTFSAAGTRGDRRQN